KDSVTAGVTHVPPELLSCDFNRERTGRRAGAKYGVPHWQPDRHYAALCDYSHQERNRNGPAALSAHARLPESHSRGTGGAPDKSTEHNVAQQQHTAGRPHSEVNHAVDSSPMLRSERRQPCSGSQYHHTNTDEPYKDR